MELAASDPDRVELTYPLNMDCTMAPDSSVHVAPNSIGNDQRLGHLEPSGFFDETAWLDDIDMVGNDAPENMGALDATLTDWTAFQPDAQAWQSLDPFVLVQVPFAGHLMSSASTLNSSIPHDATMPNPNLQESWNGISEDQSLMTRGAEPAGNSVERSSRPREDEFRLVLRPIDAKPFRGTHSPEVWKSHKATIKRLYLDEGKPLKAVMETMTQEYQFKATEKMYKTRIRVWGFEKNNTEKRMSQMVLAKLHRDAAGKESRFVRHGKEVNFLSYLKRRGITEFGVPVDVTATPLLPDAVRCRTPSPPPEAPSYLSSPDFLRYRELHLQHARALFHRWRGGEKGISERIGFKASLAEDGISERIGFKASLAEDGLSYLVNSTRHFEAGRQRLGAIFRKRAYKAFAEQLDTGSEYSMIQLLLMAQDISDARVLLPFWRFLAAYSAPRKREDPIFHWLAFAYEVLQKSGLGGLQGVIEQSRCQVAEELEKALGATHWHAMATWSALKLLLPREAAKRFSANLETTREWVKETSSCPGGRTHLFALYEHLYVLDDLTHLVGDYGSIVRCAEQFQRALAKSSSVLTAHEKITMERLCALVLCRAHWSLCESQEGGHNPRIGLVIHSMENVIDLTTRDAGGEDHPAVLHNVSWLKGYCQWAGLTAKAETVRKLEERCLVAIESREQQLNAGSW